ncbi:MAG: ribosomal-processing cysteine protease Prp [Eubacteriales bacterium]|nr:ribosomal-processing cysteine protease Prp [Eubacteriales bacterium]
MTHVTIYRNENKECVGFTVIGHADYADAGEDVVCAALSMLVINTCNAIEKFTSARFSLVTNGEEGLIDFRLKDNLSEQTELLLSAMILGIETMVENEDYEEYIQLSFEEV